MSGGGPTLTPNTLTIIELEGDALADLLWAAQYAHYKVAVMLEVEPDGAVCVKIKPDEASWSPPFPLTGEAASVERLYP